MRNVGKILSADFMTHGLHGYLFIQGGVEKTLAGHRMRGGVFLHRSRVHHRTNVKRKTMLIFTHVFALWEERREPGKNH